VTLTVLVLLTTAVLVATTLWESRRPIGTALILPGVWLVTIPVQSVVLASKLGFGGSARDNLYVAIAVANVAFAGFQLLDSFGVLDRFRARVQHLADRQNDAGAGDHGNVRYWFGGLLVVAVGLAILHWSVMPGIPLVQMIQGADAYQLQIARENSAKLLAVPTILKYAFTWDSRVFFPILLVTAVLYRWKWVAVLVGVFGFIYLVSPLERLPAVLFLLAPFAAVAIRDGKRVWSPLVIVGVVVALLPALAITEILDYEISIHPAPAGSTVADPNNPTTDNSPVSPGEFKGLPVPVAAALDLVLRRIGQGPTDVTYEWFAYFPNHHPYLNGSGWEPWRVLGSGYQTPANMVGLWAYYGKRGYNLTSISAYGSFVADGWSEFGLAGVILACVLLLAVGLGLEVMRALGTRPFLLACYVVPLVLISTVTPQSSLPAMVLSSGVFLTPLLAAGYLLTNRAGFSTFSSLRLEDKPRTT
jgi:hypothetical protein